MSSSSSTAVSSAPVLEDTISTLSDRAFTHLSKSEWTAARDILLQALALGPQIAQLHAALGSACYYLADYHASGTAFARAVELQPYDLDLLKQAAHVYLKINNTGAAEGFLRQAALMQPDDAQVQEMLGQCRKQPAAPVVELPLRNRASQVALDPGLTLAMGDHSYVHDGQIRNPSQARTHVTIGRFCSIASDFVIIGYDHRSDWITTYPFLDPWTKPAWPGTANTTLPAAPDLGGNFDRGRITIGHDVWIGYGVKLFKGVTIGDGAVIGACSLVNKDVPPYTIVAGIPARPIRKRFTDDEIAILSRIAWWDWPEEKINRYMPYLCSSRIAELEALLAAEPANVASASSLDRTAPPAPDAIDFEPVNEFLRRRPAGVQGAISDEDAKFIHATIAELRPDVVLEIGVASGFSSALILKSLDIYAPHASLVSYDISPWCYYDSTLEVGYCVPAIIPEHRARFQLITGADQLSNAKTAVSAFKRKLIFIDANHNPPYPALDLLHTLDLATPGDIFLFHDINLPVLSPKFAYSCGAMELYQILPEPKWSSLGEKNNLGAYRFDGNYLALWKVLSRYLATFKFNKDNLTALLWLARKAGQV